MKADSTAATVRGIWLEFVDAAGHTVAHHIVDDWQGHALPARGTMIRCRGVHATGDTDESLNGVVMNRQFDLQHTIEGEPELWARLTLRVVAKTLRPRHPAFSRN